jgi:hypothetical protein
MTHVPIAVLISVKLTLKNNPARISETVDYGLYVRGAIVQKQDAYFYFAARWNQSDSHVPEMQTSLSARDVVLVLRRSLC